MEIISTFLYICGGFATIGGTITLLYKLYLWVKKPVINNTDHIIKNQNEISNIKIRLNNDDNRLVQIEADVSMVLKALVGLFEHAINGNDTQQLKLIRDELVNHIVKF